MPSSPHVDAHGQVEIWFKILPLCTPTKTAIMSRMTLCYQWEVEMAKERTGVTLHHMLMLRKFKSLQLHTYSCIRANFQG